MTRFNDVTTQFSEYARRTKGRFMEQVGSTFLPPNLSPNDFYAMMLPLVQGNIERSVSPFRPGEAVDTPVQISDMGNMWLQMNMESKWYELGAPEYKIHPGMVEALAHTNLEIPGREVHFPFPVFAVRLPHHHLREHEDAPWIRSMLVAEIYERQLGQLRRKISMISCFEPEKGVEDPFTASISTKFEIDMSTDSPINVAECVARMDLGQYDSGYWPSREMSAEIVALAISTALLAIGADKSLIRQVPITSTERTKRRKLVRNHGPVAAGSDRPFEVGADIKLPRRERNYGRSSSDESGRHLKWAHIRSGHIRLQRCKVDGEWVRVPTFIKPTMVRKDLPMRPKTTPRAVL